MSTLSIEKEMIKRQQSQLKDFFHSKMNEGIIVISDETDYDVSNTDQKNTPFDI